MDYRRVGHCGLKVSALSLGAGNFGGAVADVRAVRELMAAAADAGINYFDNAESYGGGRAEALMGEALQALHWPRLRYIVATKFFWGLGSGPNEKNTLNRKYLLHSIDESLRRLQLDYVDIVYCHRADPHTSLEETVWALHDIIRRGKALYWGTSEWSADQIEAACAIAERHHLHKPIVEQPEYNLLNRRRVETEYSRVCRERHIGLAVWSPLAGGALTGKYVDGIPTDSRAADQNVPGLLRQHLTDSGRNGIVTRLRDYAKREGLELAPCALAWCLRNPQVSTAIIGASTTRQLALNLQALELKTRLTPEFLQGMTHIVGDYSASWVGSSPWHYE